MSLTYTKDFSWGKKKTQIPQILKGKKNFKNPYFIWISLCSLLSDDHTWKMFFFFLNGDHPYKYLAKSGYKQDMEYKIINQPYVT
jgi:hypothetical protein